MICVSHWPCHRYPQSHKHQGKGINMVKLTWGGKLATLFTIISPPIQPHFDLIYINPKEVRCGGGGNHILSEKSIITWIKCPFSSTVHLSPDLMMTQDFWGVELGTIWCKIVPMMVMMYPHHHHSMICCEWWRLLIIGLMCNFSIFGGQKRTDWRKQQHKEINNHNNRRMNEDKRNTHTHNKNQTNWKQKKN